LFREQGGILRTSEALRPGIHPCTLYALRDAGVLEQLSRGLYRLAAMPPLVHPDLVTVALKVPQAVIGLRPLAQLQSHFRPFPPAFVSPT